MPTKIVRSARWSDLESAGRASARLVEARDATRSAPGVVVPPPVRWASLAARVEQLGARAPATEAPLTPPPEIDLAALDAAGDRGWNAWLSWACEVAPADAAFVVDRHGLPVASYGELADDDREASATRLVMALDQAARLSSEDHGADERGADERRTDEHGADERATSGASVSIDWRGRAWSATRCADVVLCLVSVDAIPRARMAHVAEAITRAAAGLAS